MKNKIDKVLTIVCISIIICTLLLISLWWHTAKAQAYEYKFTNNQQKRADYIADEVIKHYDKYGCLPSIAIAQAYLESQIGDNRIDDFNYWGLGGQLFFKYWSLHDGVHAYMGYINNGNYPGAPFEKDWRVQIRKILDGNYCVPEGTYESDIHWVVRTFDLEKYDRKLFKKLKEKERKKLWEKEYVVAYNPTVPQGRLQVDDSIIKKGTIVVYGAEDYTMKGIYDMISGQTGTVVSTSDRNLAWTKVILKVYEEAEG